jgi:hypothetical protein
MSNLHFTKKNRANIRERVFAEVGAEQIHFTKSRFNYRTLAIAACITVFLVAGMFGAVALDIINPSAIHKAFFGDGAEYIGFNVNAVNENSGIEMRLVSAVSDGKNVYTFIEITDELGRLDDKSGFEELKSYNESAIGGQPAWITPYIQSVDKNHISMVLKLTSKHKIYVGNTLKISAPKLLTGYDYISLDTGVTLSDFAVAVESTLERSELTNISKNLNTEYDNINHKELQKTIPLLIKDQTNVLIAGIPWAVISNIGYVDDKLHIQTRYAEGYDQYLRDSGSTANLQLLDENGTEIPFALHAYGYAGAGYHEEYIYDVDRETIKTCNLNMWRQVVDETIAGPWNLTFKVESEVPNFDFSDKNLKFEVTPLGVEIKISRNAVDYNEISHENAVNYILLKDGTKIPLYVSSGDMDNDTGKGTVRFVNDYYNIEKFKSVIINEIEHSR